jgi:hypothetical protein
MAAWAGDRAALGAPRRAPMRAAADRPPDRVVASLPAPFLPLDRAPSAVPVPAPSLRATTDVPFLLATVQDEGEAGPAAAHAGIDRPARLDRAAGRPPGRSESAPAMAAAPDPARPAAATEPAGLSVGTPPARPPAPASLAAPAPAPLQAEVVAAIPETSVVPVPAPLSSVKPRKRARHAAPRRRIVVMTPRDVALPQRSRRTKPVLNRMTRGGETGPRSRVTVIYGTPPRRGFGPVLIRIRAARNGRIRTSRIPLD